MFSRKVDVSEQGPSGLYRSFLSRCFRDVRKVDYVDIKNETRESSSLEQRFDDCDAVSMYHANFIRVVERVAPQENKVVCRVVDVKSIGGHDSVGEPVGFAVLCKDVRDSGRVQGLHCMIQLYHEHLERDANLPSDFTVSSPNPETGSSLSDCTQLSHGQFHPSPKIIVKLPDGMPTTKMIYAGNGILLFVTTSAVHPGRIEFVDLLSDSPILQRIDVEQREVVSANVSLCRSGEVSQIILSCLTKRSHFCVKIERSCAAAGTPRFPLAIQINCGGSVEVGHQSVDQLPFHLAISATVALIFPSNKLGVKWTMLRVQETQIIRDKIDLKGKVTSASRFFVNGKQVVLVGNEEGHVASLPLENESEELQATKIFEGEIQQRAVVRFEATSSPNLFVCFTRTSAALVCVTDAGRICALSKKINTLPTEYALQYVHLHRDISGNPNFVLLWSDLHDTCVNLSSFQKLSNVCGPAANAVEGNSSHTPPQSMRDVSSTPVPNTAAPTASSSSLSFRERMVATFKAKFQKKTSPNNDAEQFAPAVTDVITQFCEGFCRKSLTSTDDQHRIIPLDARLHGFIVWLKLHTCDEVLFLGDQTLQGLSRLHREEM